MLVRPGALARALRLELIHLSAKARRRSGRLRQRRFDHILAAVDRVVGAGKVDRLAGKARKVDLGIGGDHHCVGGLDILGSDHVLGADRALCLDLDLMAQRLGGVFQRLGGHKRVRDAGRAGRYPHQPLGAVGGGCGRGARRRGINNSGAGTGRGRRGAARQRDRLVDYIPGIADRRAGRGAKHRFAGEALVGDADVDRKDYHVRRGDRFGRERVFGTVRALRFDGDLVAQHGGGFAQCLGGHNRMGDSGRTGSNGDNLGHRSLHDARTRGVCSSRPDRDTRP